MPHHFDPMEQAMKDAQQRVVTAGMSGGEGHAKVDDATVIMASMGWAVQKIEASNAKLAKELCGSEDTVRDKIKKNGPAASAGALIVGAAAFIKEWLGG